VHEPARIAVVLDPHHEEIWTYLSRCVGRALAEDLASETFIARLPRTRGIQLLGLTHDGIGRPALAVALSDTLYGSRHALLFDPKTSSLLGERSVVVKPARSYHVKPGTVWTGATHISSGIVERIGQVPGG
jgi:hypothetical protein